MEMCSLPLDHLVCALFAYWTVCLNFTFKAVIYFLKVKDNNSVLYHFNLNKKYENFYISMHLML